MSGQSSTSQPKGREPPGPADDFMPPSPVGAEAVNLVTSLVAGVIEHLVPEASGLGGVVGASVAFVRLAQANMKDAGKAFAKTYEAHRQEFKRLEDRVKAGEIEQETLQRRLTMTQRALHEAGRHPDRLLREALGTFAARVLVTDMNEVEAFDASELLARMTALDFEYLRFVGAARAVGGSYHRKRDDPAVVVRDPYSPGRDGSGLSPAILAASFLPVVFKEITVAHVERADARLLSMRLIEARPRPGSTTHDAVVRTGFLGDLKVETTSRGRPWPDENDDRLITDLGVSILQVAGTSLLKEEAAAILERCRIVECDPEPIRLERVSTGVPAAPPSPPRPRPPKSRPRRGK